MIWRHLRRLAVALGLWFVCHGVWAQATLGLVAYYSFDLCDASDDTGNGADGVISGAPDCECGPSGNALRLNGVNDDLRFLGSFDLLFAGDFTISFYFLPENSPGIIDILSKKENCTIDNSIAIRYESGSQTLRAEIAESINFRSESRAVLDGPECWKHITWVRNGANLFLYVNGVLVHTVNTPGFLDVSNNGIMSIANSPCLANGEQRFAGRIDELRMYNRALSTAEVGGLYLQIDHIATRDTFVFLGDGAQISVPNSCALGFTWSPTNNVVTPGISEPFISPTQTTTYQLRMDYPSCFATDTVRITVIDSSQVDCNDVFVPNAFTPNGDHLNDEFGVSNRFFLGEFIALEIYDRWGSQLFRSVDPFVKWDGTANGEDSIPDMYLYKLYYRCNGEEQARAGGFNLIK
ncbi:MAG TPA: LamG-like jellyroll fold domain-containing protein [Saprospiraceae bacterium]|nr:LamG-like jellyroll fold domain-containing protein [Saprospiraceae bacterium]